MDVANIHEAKTHFSKLVERAEQGEEIVIARGGKPVAKLVPYHESRGPRTGGEWRGQVWMSPDFDELPEGFAEAFGISEKKDVPA